ncbi:PepSY domain-containing protein [Aldersonia sp. NBC_00410]|uniref:PepSY-associated TM helix domain-containing protein n=1 Tax=Aldersonia sp. NBC_00410 TaxID=2975954 RepID=UPI002255D3F7|nr:PepSY-associated TM helix domain-containing protein [Aldersonia sp. NBC_00410]MCX5041927.1 PepSY domain-containing protein [Aldersonia sp. NBC_00410]
MTLSELGRGDLAADFSPPPGGAPRRSLRPLILRLHFYAGILIAPFLVVATISGGLYALAPSLEKVVYRDYLHVDSTGPAAPVADQVRAAQLVQPDLTLNAVRPAAQPGDTTRVLFDDPSLGESERRAVFVDPVTATPRGDLVVYGSSSALPMRTWISQLHRHLHLGEPGRIYSELAASWLWVVALGGCYLWFVRHRTNRARNGSAARLWTLDRSTRGRARTMNWHGVVGIWLAVGLVFLSATGLTWSRFAGENIGELRTALSWTTPTVDTTLGGGHEGHGGMAATAGAEPAQMQARIDELDGVLALAARNGVSNAVEASIPTDVHTAFTVAETRQPWQFATDTVVIDGASGTVTDESRFADWPLAAKLTTWGIGLHMGILFGLANQIALALLAVLLVTVIVRGYLMWWRRRPVRSGRPIGHRPVRSGRPIGHRPVRSGRVVGRPPVRGGLRRIGPARLAGVIVATVLVGWFVPLLGLSLLGFLAVDLAVGHWRARSAVTP